VSKAITRSLLTLSLLAILSGCGKEQPPSKAATAPQAPATGAQQPAAMNHPTAKPGAEVDLSGITKAEGGKTVAELYAEKDQLANKKVTLRGKVVKTNAGIMGKNWLHVRDGSGAEGANDLTVTTTSAELPKVGDTVVVTGQVGVNKDFGMGYQYAVILEDAAVTIEAAGS
jgi:hypothetical protein